MSREHLLGETATLAVPGASGRAHLLVVENGSSWTFALPLAGAVTIGRADEAEVRVEHPSVSRQHARVVRDRNALRVEDLGSHNGTRVNGEPIAGPRVLAPGDVISVGEVTVVLQGATESPAPRQTLAEAEWRRRLDEEVARSLTYRRPLSVVVIANVPAPTRSAAADGLATILRLIDVVGHGADGQLCVLLPEMAADGVRDLVVRGLARIAAAAPDAAAGYACCPTDACDADTLVLTARAAARAAGRAQVLAAGDAATVIELGERRVLLGHPAMLRVFDLIRRLAAHDLPVLVSGETGAGKENAAYAVHWWSSRRARPFITINCAAIPDALVESELFGHERGAFSGAVAARAGLFESAEGGTVFLDEVGELPLATQAKLLRAVEGKRITRVGEVKERAIDVRLVAATNRSLADEVKAGRFREDLFFRLGAATVVLPPLRERRGDIPVLARDLLGQACDRAGRARMEITPAAMQLLATYAWPGNVRELRNAMDFVAAAALDDRVEPDDLPATFAAAAVELEAAPVEAAASGFAKLADEIEALERQRIVESLEAAGGVKTKAAALIGMPIRTFAMKLKQYGLGRG